MRMESIDLRIRDAIEFYGRIFNEESDRASISALRNRCDFAFEKQSIPCAPNFKSGNRRYFNFELRTSDSAREFDRLRGGRILAQNPKYRRFPKYFPALNFQFQNCQQGLLISIVPVGNCGSSFQ